MNGSAPARPRFHPSWWMLPACIISVTALFLMCPGKHPGIPIMLLFTGAAYFLRLRMPESGPIRWIIRGVLFGIILFSAPERQNSRLWYLDPGVVATIGMLLEAELMVQHFLPIDGRMRIGRMLVITAGILACGTLNPDSRLISLLAPAYVICVLGILREFRPVITSSPTMDTAPPPRTSRRWLLQGTAIVLALTFGFACSTTLRAFYMGFSGYGIRLMQKLFPMPAFGGMSGDEQLRGEYNFGASAGRNLKIYGTIQAMHLRGLAFDTYENGRWLPMVVRRQLARVGDFPSLPQSAKTFQVERLEDQLQLLYLPLNTPGFTTPPRSTNQVERGHRHIIESTTEKGDTMIYTVAMGSSDLYQGPLCAPLSDQERTICLAVPGDIEPQVRAIAATLKRDDAAHTAREVAKWLQDNKKYGTKSSFTSGRDPVSEFILEDKPAHCQFFASSAAIMLRLNGIPARYVTGYFAHEPASGNSMVVRGRDAHAWVEAWIDGTGWIEVEATPASGTPPGMNLEVGLYQKIKDFLSDVISAIGGFVRSLSWQQIAMAGGVVVAIALSMQWVKTWRARRKLPRIRSYAFPHEQYRRMALEFEQLLKRSGDGPSGAATWSEYLTNMSAQTRRTGRQQKLDAAQRFVRAYNSIRFGNPNDMASLQDLRRLLDEIKEA